MKQSKIFIYGILTFEIIIIGFWFYKSQPEAKTSIDLFKVIPILFGINLMVGLLLYFIKKPLAILFFANAIICPMVFYATWIMWFTYWAK